MLTTPVQVSFCQVVTLLYSPDVVITVRKTRSPSLHFSHRRRRLLSLSSTCSFACLRALRSQYKTFHVRRLRENSSTSLFLIDNLPCALHSRSAFFLCLALLFLARLSSLFMRFSLFFPHPLRNLRLCVAYTLFVSQPVVDHFLLSSSILHLSLAFSLPPSLVLLFCLTSFSRAPFLLLLYLSNISKL